MFKIFKSSRMLSVLILGFSSGLPLMLTAGGSTIQAWLKDSKIDLAVIGRFALIGLPYALKFLWAPFLDSFSPPFLTRRRGWAVIAQVCLVLCFVALSLTDPVQSMNRFIFIAACIAFFGASQDIVLDAFRTEILTKEELGPGGSIYLMGYRLAMLVSGALALALSKFVSWQIIYLLMSVVMILGIIVTLKIDEPIVPLKEYQKFKDRVLVPFADFFRRPAAMEILLFVMLYKLPTLMATALTTVFLMDLGFDKIQIAAVSKVAGLIATIVGTLCGGAMMVKLGMKRSLWIFGFVQALGGALFIILAVLGKNHAAMIGVLVADNFLMGMGTAAIVGFMMSICSAQFTATQYALLSSLSAFTRVILISPAGSIAKALGWSHFFIFSVLLAIPGLLLLLRFDGWSKIANNVSESSSLSKYDVIMMSTFLGGLIVISTDFLWPKIGLPDIALWVGAGLLLFSLVAWGLKVKNNALSR